MYDVASTDIPIRSTTGELVGPATYVICNTKHQRKNCAPFLSTTAKDSSFLTRLNTDAVYDVRECGKRIIGGGSLKNRAPRFVYKTSDTPGPTRYTPKPIQCSKKKLKLDPTKPKLYICAVPYTNTVIAPSIPSKNDENGYELDDDGNITKIPPEEPVPIELNIKSQFENGKGCKWSCRTSARFNSKQYLSCGPGPAAYSTKIPKCRRAEEDEFYREMARRFSFVPRFAEAEELKAAKQKFPGPGSYNISPPSRSKAESIKPKPFIRGAPRFPKIVSDTPSPAAYQECDCVKKRRCFCVREDAFGIRAPRFKKENRMVTPAPGDYEIKGALQEKIEKKKNPSALVHAPFNSTAYRDLNFAPKDAPYMPSSADYPLPKLVEEDDEEEDEGKVPISSSVFMNMVCRFFSPGDKKDYIGPAKYNVAKSFDKNRERKSFNVAEVAFNSSGPRSTTPAVKSGVPCPTTYETELELECKGYHFALSPRFTCQEETPGPGSYKIHPRVETSIYKAYDTHNLRLKENILRKKLRLAPTETRKQWLRTMKKRKLLKWFDVELDYEERMCMLIQKLFDKPD